MTKKKRVHSKTKSLAHSSKRKKKTFNKKVEKKKFNRFAIAGFVLSFFGFLSLLGIIFSSIALIQINKKKQKGRGLAIAGLVLGIFVFLMNIVFISVIILFLFGAINLNTSFLEGPGKLTIKEYDLTGFKKIELQGEGNLYLTQGENYSIKIEAGENVLKNLEIDLVEDFLIIEKNWNLFLGNGNSIKVYITMPKIEYLSLVGSGDILGETKINSENLSLFIFGSGDIKINSESKYLRTGIFGSGNIILDGKSEKTSISIVGSGDCKMKNFETKEVLINIEGSGNVLIKVLESLDVEIAGSGDVTYSGNPEVEEKIYGSGSLKKIN